MQFDLDRPIGTEAGEIDSQQVRNFLQEADGQPVTILIHSEGGSVFEGFAIYDTLKAYQGRVTVRVQSMAFSAAAIVALAADEIEVAPSSYMMVHNSSLGGSDLNPSQRDLLSKLDRRMTAIICEKTGKPESTVRRWMDGELFFDAQAAVAAGLADRISATSQARSIPVQALAKIIASATGTRPASAVASWKQAVKAAGSVREAIRRNPGLRERYVAEVNNQPAPPPPPAATGARNRWKALIDEKVAGGMARHIAARQVAREQPDLRLQVVAEARSTRRR